MTRSGHKGTMSRIDELSPSLREAINKMINALACAPEVASKMEPWIKLLNEQIWSLTRLALYDEDEDDKFAEEVEAENNK